MPFDMEPVRQVIAGIVTRAIPELRRVYDYEDTTETLDNLPLAMLFPDTENGGRPGDPLGELGSITRTYPWKIRVYLQVEPPGRESQLFIDQLRVRLVEAFVDSGNIEALQAVGVDQPAVTETTSDGAPGGVPLALVEATLETVITWTP